MQVFVLLCTLKPKFDKFPLKEPRVRNNTFRVIRFVFLKLGFGSLGKSNIEFGVEAQTTSPFSEYVHKIV